MDELLTALASGDGDELFEKYLECASRFWRYSAPNVGLILLQTPKATRVAGRNTWLRLNRSLRKGCRATWIWCPRFYSKSVVNDDTGEVESISQRHFVLAPVFDLSDTEVIPGCQDRYVPSFNNDLGAGVQPLIEAATAWAEGVGYEVKYRPLFRQFQGLGVASRGRIEVDNTIAIGQRLATVIHELAHQRLSHLDLVDADRRLCEGEAESSCFVVLRHFGYDAPASAAYLRNHHVTPAMVSASLKRITEAAKEIIDGIEAHLPSPRQEAPTTRAPVEASP